MEEVRSYWQVASIQHFCTLFQKPFKLPSFEPEELEQAFIIDVPESSRSISISFNSINNNNHNNIASEKDEVTNGEDRKPSGDDDDDDADQDDQTRMASRRSSPDYIPPFETKPDPNQLDQQQQQHPNENKDDLHLLVKLAISLLKPHFNSKISPVNWENYLVRLIDLNWVGLENCPSPFSIPIISPDGVELPKSLTFRDLPLSDKIDVFSALCDYRLWCEDASELLKDYPMEELRLESIGKDAKGYEYWYFSGTRLFRENIELSQKLIQRKKEIKELEYKLIELERDRILKDQEDKKKAELERAKHLAAEAREARMAAKRQQEQEIAASSRANKRKRGSTTPVLPPRTGLRERRSSAAGNNNDSQETPSRTLRSRAKPTEPQIQETTPISAAKSTRGAAKELKQTGSRDRSQVQTPDEPGKSQEERCREELEEKRITLEERYEAWSVACESLEEWENFPKKFEKTKSTNEKYLTAHIVDVLLPHIQGIYAKRAAEIRRKEKELMFSLASRRTSTRITSKRAQEEEEERQAKLREAEILRMKAEAEANLRAELEREIRAKQNRFVINGGTSSACSEDGGEDSTGRYNLRQNQHDSQNIASNFDGIIHPDKLGEFYEALELIVDTVRTTKHAWPFVEDVSSTEPGYNDLIKQPMYLKKIRDKVEFKKYKSLLEIEKDFQLLINNCEKYNGPKNTFTKMAHRLWKSFRKNVMLYLERDLHMNEFETFLYPPEPPAPPIQPTSRADTTRTDVMTQNGNGNLVHNDMETNDEPQHSHIDNTERSMASNGVNVQEFSDGDMIQEKKNLKLESCVTSGLDHHGSEHPISIADMPSILNSGSHDSLQPAVKSELILVLQPTPIEGPVEIIEESEFPPEPVCEEVIIESCVEPCPDAKPVVPHRAITESGQPVDN